MKPFLSVFLLFFALSGAIAQTRVVEGKVTALEDGQPLPGVNVIVQGTSKGTATDFEGHYRIELATGENTLNFSFIGYKTVSENVGERTTVDVVLELDTKSLEEVVVVAYGTQKKSDLTGAISSLRGTDLTKIPALDPTMALQGKVAGVQVTSSSGAPGSQPIVRIRGTGTFGDASPIYVVDGVILQDISFLNSSDIQSMEVLKDASATALYGSRGANGVILISTKQGKAGAAPVITFAADYSMQDQTKRIDLLNGPQFATVVNEITPGSYNNISAVPNTDWQSQIFRKPSAAPIQNYQFSASAGSDKMQYYIGVGYFRQDGIIPKSYYERVTIRLNNIYHLSKNVRLGNNLTLAPYQQQNTNGNVVFTAYRAQPVITPFDASGNYNPVPNVGNPLADIDYTNSYAKGLRTVGNFYVEADFLKGFTAKSSFGVDLVNSRSYDFTPKFFVNAQQQNSLSTLNKTYTRQPSWLWENTITYNKEIGKHRVNALGGFTLQESSSEFVAIHGRDILRDGKDFWYVDPNTAAVISSSENSVDPNHYFSMVSFLGRVNYTYDNRYLLTATFRRDGSSKFTPSNKYANFPSFAAGWNIINEEFMKSITSLSNLKLRASWGIIGNEKIPYEAQYSSTTGAKAVFGPSLLQGLTYGVSGNSNLKWESTQQIDIGLEAGFLNDRLTIETDYYHRDTRDILVNLAVESYLGNGPGATITYNAAEVLNAGFELTAVWKDQINSNWGYRIGGNATTIQNKVLKVFPVGGPDDYIYGLNGGSTLSKTTPGRPIGEFFLYQTAGVFQNAAQVASTPHLSGAQPGDLIYADINNDGKINDQDRTFAGSPIPTLLYGLNLGATFKSWDLSVDLNGVSGNKIYNYKETVRPDLYNFEKHVYGRWTGEGTTNTEPRATSGGNNWIPSNRFIQNGAYVRLRSVSLSYSLSKKASDKMKMKSARVFARGTNLFTKSKFTGFTPEVASSSPILTGIDTGTYPLPAIYTVGLNVTF